MVTAERDDADALCALARDADLIRTCYAEIPVLGLDHVILTPHLAWYTREAFERVEQDTLDGIMAVLEGRRPKHLKNTEVLGPALSGQGDR